ncbi:MAG: hypothetical protein R2881_05700 [Eubacteriales bacterium]
MNGVRSHAIIKDALEILVRLAHPRGGTGSDPDTGDGMGDALQLPDKFSANTRGCISREGEYAVGMFFAFGGRNRRAADRH